MVVEQCGMSIGHREIEPAEARASRERRNTQGDVANLAARSSDDKLWTRERICVEKRQELAAIGLKLRIHHKRGDGNAIAHEGNEIVITLLHGDSPIEW